MRIEQIEETSAHHQQTVKLNTVFLSAFDAKKTAQRLAQPSPSREETYGEQLIAASIRATVSSGSYVGWFKAYVNNPEFIKLYANEATLEAVGEATFWSVQLGLAPLLAKMSYAEIREFRSLEEWTFKDTERGVLIGKVASMLKKPTNSQAASFALVQAAWASYVNKNGFDVMKAQEKIWQESKDKNDPQSTASRKSKL